MRYIVEFIRDFFGLNPSFPMERPADPEILQWLEETRVLGEMINRALEGK
jgi:hypothetical protein